MGQGRGRAGQLPTASSTGRAEPALGGSVLFATAALGVCSHPAPAKAVLVSPQPRLSPASHGCLARVEEARARHEPSQNPTLWGLGREPGSMPSRRRLAPLRVQRRAGVRAPRVPGDRATAGARPAASAPLGARGRRRGGDTPGPSQGPAPRGRPARRGAGTRSVWGCSLPGAAAAGEGRCPLPRAGRRGPCHPKGRGRVSRARASAGSQGLAAGRQPGARAEPVSGRPPRPACPRDPSDWPGPAAECAPQRGTERAARPRRLGPPRAGAAAAPPKVRLLTSERRLLS